VRVGVDGERAAGRDGQPQQPAGRIPAFGAAVDLHGDTVVPAGGAISRSAWTARPQPSAISVTGLSRGLAHGRTRRPR
jgi:hypothetical protein